MKSCYTTHILCFGNTLHSDDGFGEAVYHALNDIQLPEKTKVYNVGVAGLNALSLFENCDYVIVVDALHDDTKVGQLHDIDPIQAGFYDQTLDTGHQAGVLYLLHAVKTMVHPSPTIAIMGVTIQHVNTFNIGLSPIIAAAVLPTVNKIIEKISHWNSE